VGSAQKFNPYALTEFLFLNSKLTQYSLPFPYRNETRLVWGRQHLLQILATVKPNAYFTHLTAMWLHDLTTGPLSEVYLNHEQRPHIRNVELEQTRIDAAFKRRPRRSNNTIDVGDHRVVLLNGMHTKKLGVETKKIMAPDNDPFEVEVTGLERTLLDIVVRPNYGGGVDRILEAFVRAKGLVNIEKMYLMLKSLNYVYPYHQAIGYYLERANYTTSQLSMFEQLPMKFEFYLDYAMSETVFVERWKLHVPKSEVYCQ
jgi:predicted transcriptional regulator of viral defense system